LPYGEFAAGWRAWRPGEQRNENMLGSITCEFSEPENFEAALRSEGCLGLLITERGRFRARLTQISLHRFHLSGGDEQLARITFIAVPAGVVLISFPIGNGALPVYGGIAMRVGEIMTLGPGEQVHARTDGQHRWGAISVPIDELVEYGRALTGVPFAVPPIVQHWLPPPAAGRDLRSLHAAAIRMATIRPQVLLDVQAARGLERQLIHALVECLVGGSSDKSTEAACRHRDIMARFERLLQNQPDRALRMTEICAALGVSQRLLRSLCAEHLGMSPTTYDRRRRLSLARRALRCADLGTASVSEVAQRYGFHQLGRFAINYRAAFAESPSATLRRSDLK
jgi:AraC-like DNA-binding protein